MIKEGSGLSRPRKVAKQILGGYQPANIWASLSVPTENESWVESIVHWATTAVRCVSPYNLLLGRRWLPGSRPGDVYVLAWMVLLTTAGPLFDRYQVGWLWWMILLLSAFRLLDILAVQLGILLVDRKRDHHYLQSIERSAILAILNIAQAAICFGVGSAALARLFPNAFVFAADCHTVMTNGCSGYISPQYSFDYIYMCWGQLLTVGSKYSPVTAGAEAVHMLAVGTGLLLVVLSLAAFVGGLKLSGPEATI